MPTLYHPTLPDIFHEDIPDEAVEAWQAQGWLKSPPKNEAAEAVRKAAEKAAKQ